MGVDILPLQPSDASDVFAQVVALAQDEYALTGDELDPSVITTNPDDFSRWLEMDDSVRPFSGCKAVDETGKMVGFVLFSDKGFGSWSGSYVDDKEPEAMLVDDMRVEEAYRSQGIGTRLIAKAAEAAKAKGLPMTLVVHEKNARAKDLYSRLGATMIGVDTSRAEPDFKMRFDEVAIDQLIDHASSIS